MACCGSPRGPPSKQESQPWRHTCPWGQAPCCWERQVCLSERAAGEHFSPSRQAARRAHPLACEAPGEAGLASYPSSSRLVPAEGTLTPAHPVWLPFSAAALYSQTPKGLSGRRGAGTKPLGEEALRTWAWGGDSLPDARHGSERRCRSQSPLGGSSSARLGARGTQPACLGSGRAVTPCRAGLPLWDTSQLIPRPPEAPGTRRANAAFPE